MVKFGYCLQQMQRKERQQNPKAVGVETEKDSVGEQASAMVCCYVRLPHDVFGSLCPPFQLTQIDGMVQAPSAWQVGVLVGMERDVDNSPKVLAWHDCGLMIQAQNCSCQRTCHSICQQP